MKISGQICDKKGAFALSPFSVLDGAFDLLRASILLPRLTLQGVGRDEEYFGRESPLLHLKRPN